MTGLKILLLLVCCGFVPCTVIKPLTYDVSGQNPNFYIYLCFGQSNMEGQGAIEARDLDVNSRFQVFQPLDCPNLSRTKGKWYPAVPPTCQCFSGLSPADYFGRTMVENLPKEITVGIINVAVGGSDIRLFDKDLYQDYDSTYKDNWFTSKIVSYGGNPYRHLINLARLAQKDGVIKGILLHQGETNTGQAEWPQYVRKIYHDMLTDLSLSPESVPLLAGEVLEGEKSCCSRMNPIIQMLPKVIPTAYVISSKGCAGQDQAHFNSQGYRILGRRYAEKMLSFMGITIPAQDKTEFTVSPDGTGDFTSVQAAIDACKAFPDQRITIHLKNGTYHEKVVVPSCNTRLSIIGEDPEKTIITWDDHFSKINRGRNSTFYTYTMKVEADDFYMENVTVENSAGPVGQAVALHVEGNRCSFRNCRILGNQDTLYTAGQNSRQLFSNCTIEGTTDFIFGAATVLFEKCTIHSKSDSYITAASTPKDMPYGYVFLQCRLTAAEGVKKVYLGRPWRDFAQTVYLRCEMGASIAPEGWANWGGTQRNLTAYYAEFRNTGPGAATSGRVPWSHQLTVKEARKYTSGNVFGNTLEMNK